MHAHRALNVRPERCGSLVDVDAQRAAVPAQGIRADDQRRRRAPHGALTALGERPAPAFSVQGDVERAELQRLCQPMRCEAAGSRVERRKDAADKRDQGEPVPSVIAQRIDIPPGVAASGYDTVEARSSISALAAKQPDSATIGTPGPGWILPPARYRPGILLRLRGR